ncbi:hypothetical protein J2TS4_27190 [Paenibacillus sp. J2TS4]|nr:hypothetical protein J2TS4_27190 [Paenibacillus sp. J2TS4]
MYGFLRLLFQPLVRIYINFLKPVIVATITLTNGEKLYNKYIFRPSIEGNILIGDKPEPTEDCEKIMLPKSSILLK